MRVLKVVQTDQGLGVLLTEEVRAHLGVRDGDLVGVERVAEHSLQLFLQRPDAAVEIALGEAFMDDHRSTFEALAKT